MTYTPAVVAHPPLSPSPVLVHLDDALAAVLPDDLLPELTARDGAIAATTDAADRQRCLHCARWAVHLADSGRAGIIGHVVERLRAVVGELHDAYVGARLGAIVAGADPTIDVELSWVDDAVAAAVAAADQVGWSQVPWQALLDDLIAMEPSSAAPHDDAADSDTHRPASAPASTDRPPAGQAPGGRS